MEQKEPMQNIASQNTKIETISDKKESQNKQLCKLILHSLQAKGGEITKEQVLEFVEQANSYGITYSDLVLGNYYFANFNNRWNFMTKYTMIVGNFKKDYPNYIVNFINEETYVICNIVNLDNPNETYTSKVFLSQLKTSRNKNDAGMTKAFKDIMRFNFPKYVQFYDNQDLDEIRASEKAPKSSTQEQIGGIK